MAAYQMEKTVHNQGSAMASIPEMQTPVVHRKLPPIGYLYTPPEQMLDSFQRQDARPQSFDASSSSPKLKLPPLNIGPSPPTSPDALPWSNFRASSNYVAKDALLYPDNDGHAPAQVEAPLFAPLPPREPELDDGSSALQAQTSESVASESTLYDAALRTSRSRDKPRPARSFAELYNVHKPDDAKKYLQDRLYELNLYRSFPVEAQPSRTKELPRDPYSRQQLNSLGKKPTGVTKLKLNVTKPATSRHVDPRPELKTKPAPRAVTPKRSPKAAPRQGSADVMPSGGQEKKHKRAAPTKTVAGTKDDNNQWSELIDYSPPLSTLNDKNKKLKVEWKHAPLDCTGKEDYDKLDPQEQVIASALRLEPRQYLANKRRIFAARVEQLRNPGNKGWNKTACQQACNIDVNKASQLYDAFLRIGWFEKELFTKWLE